MGLPEKLLGRDEVIVRHMHEHPKALFWNVVGLIIVILAAISAFLLLPDSVPSWVNWVIVGTSVILVLVVFGYPWLQWITSTYTITNRRVITRSGIITKTGHDIPLSGISNVAYERGFMDRLSGAGTIILETSADNPLQLHDVPKVEQVHVELTDLLFHGPTTRTERP
ncbi:MAG: PH domain-containing protein [Actinomycetaceae bacterium]|nr:PH domain-containing protein [Actinomycetaceae bacterium]